MTIPDAVFFTGLDLLQCRLSDRGETLMKYTLTYAILEPKSGGTFDRKDVATFGTEFGEPLEENGLFDSEADALDTFRRYLTDHAGADYETAEDITEPEGWAGWGRVFRANSYEGAEVIYAARVEEYPND